jgi:hypothetical protein
VFALCAMCAQASWIVKNGPRDFIAIATSFSVYEMGHSLEIHVHFYINEFGYFNACSSRFRLFVLEKTFQSLANNAVEKTIMLEPFI